MLKLAFKTTPALRKICINVLTHTRDFISSADWIRRQFLSDLPGEQCGVLPLVLRYDGDDVRSQESGSAASRCFRTNDPCALKPAQNLTNAAVGDLTEHTVTPTCRYSHRNTRWRWEFYSIGYTFSILEISHGLTPSFASSTINLRLQTGRGRPFRNTPPSWFTLPSSPDTYIHKIKLYWEVCAFTIHWNFFHNQLNNLKRIVLKFR